MITSIRVRREGAHDVVTVWTHGACSGHLVVDAGEGAALERLLLGPDDGDRGWVRVSTRHADEGVDLVDVVAGGRVLLAQVQRLPGVTCYLDQDGDLIHEVTHWRRRPAPPPSDIDAARRRAGRARALDALATHLAVAVEGMDLLAVAEPWAEVARLVEALAGLGITEVEGASVAQQARRLYDASMAGSGPEQPPAGWDGLLADDAEASAADVTPPANPSKIASEP